MPWPTWKHAQNQRRKRRQQHAHACLCTADGPLLGEVERAQWEVALADGGGHVIDAATACGLPDLPKGTKALWGRSAEAAWSTDRRWQQHRQRPSWPGARSAPRARIQGP
jgi:hypothetical protein